jgi:pilus assembly protein Flp/PilA
MKGRFSMKSLFKKFVSDESGLELVEYAVMTALIVAALVTAITLLSGAISGRFGEVETVIEGI